MTSGYMAVLFIFIGRMPLLTPTFENAYKFGLRSGDNTPGQDPASGSQFTVCAIFSKYIWQNLPAYIL